MRVNELPDGFLNMMQGLLGQEYQAYLDSFEDRRLYGLRVNTMKLTAERLRELLEREVPSLTPIPWIANGFYYEEECRLSKHPCYYAGLYYLQEPSAMTPASILPIKPGDYVLDLCAAPGGKSTELGARLQGTGMLVANDISNSRAKALLKNLELFGIPNICVTSEAPDKLAAVFSGFFDKILIDAPCSGEGMFRKDPDMVKNWKPGSPEYYHGIQKEIVNQAVTMLKADGYLLYSTCTFSRLEDEEIIQFILDSHEDMELVPIPLQEGFCDGIGLSGCVRLFPHKIQGEGHFLALLHKKNDGKALVPENRANPSHPAVPHMLEKEPALGDFLKKINRTFDENRMMVKNDAVYYLPDGFPAKANLRYLRTGLLLGELKKGRFEPSQALAMALGADEFDQVLQLNQEDDRVIRYLKGETIALLPEEGPMKDWCLVCVEGFPLGFAKGTGMALKNKYYPGWRWQ